MKKDEDIYMAVVESDAWWR